ncbi:AgmX/PglI C-terminal domain-containing protein [Sorangium sp. So ce1024]|uniref:AgmX/PglI C-terminal domain-containing protein n=1 Tax=Sorangium sp. So ce1024 TaxID=3133327 RepID=UPI003EFF01D4
MNFTRFLRGSIPLVAVSSLVSVLGCGGAEPAPAAPEMLDAAPVTESRPSMSSRSEIGGMNEEKVQAAFQRASHRLSRCYERGVQRIPYLGGEIRFKVRVTEEGTARWAFVKDSTLGDRETEACMLKVLKATRWPKPVGGEGLAENSFTFEPSSDERPPVPWTPDQLGTPYKKARPALESCRSQAGASQLKATLYIDTNGKPLSVGVSSADERGEDAAECVAGALREITFPSPGSYASKVSVDID